MLAFRNWNMPSNLRWIETPPSTPLPVHFNHQLKQLRKHRSLTLVLMESLLAYHHSLRSVHWCSKAGLIKGASDVSHRLPTFLSGSETFYKNKVASWTIQLSCLKKIVQFTFLGRHTRHSTCDLGVFDWKQTKMYKALDVRKPFLK